ncbi:AAA family ATPase [Sulfitobacter sp. HGT1]|uniref:AAA family ATPase n=1 Tax=Sulfitobacter sp. HGT1 TaxID=2735435 RepID=UPI0015944457|nr:AAA family ATPase [Sulfitobacter sp. HGT1]
MANSPVFFTNKDSLRLVETELRAYFQSRLTIIEIGSDETCVVHFKIPNSKLGSKWYTYGPLSICFVSNNRSQSMLKYTEARRIIDDRTQESSFVESNSKALGFSFVTMGLSAMDYRALVDHVGVQSALEALLSVHDIISLREYRPNSTEIKNHRIRKRIVKSIVRSTEQLFLLENGIEIIRENERAAIDAARPEFECSFQLQDGRQYFYNFNFGPTADLGRRIAVLIGKNGSGKTQTLRHTAQLALGALTRGWHGNFAPSRVIGFYTGNKVSKVFPPQTLKRMVSGYKVYNMASEGGVSSSGLIDTLLGLIGSSQRIANTTRFEILIDGLKQARKNYPISVFHDDYGPIDISKIRLVRQDPTYISYSLRSGDLIEEEYSEFQDSIDRSKGVFGLRPNDLSSGEEAYIRFCIFSAAHTENGSLLLLDEPEVFLHPQFIDALMGSLHRVLELTGSVAVVATHSAYVVRCVQEDMVHIIKSDDWHHAGERVDVQRTRMKTFGADVGLISLFVFGEDEMETTKNRALKYISNLGQSGVAPEEALKSIVSEDLISKIVNSNEENR